MYPNKLTFMLVCQICIATATETDDSVLDMFPQFQELELDVNSNTEQINGWEEQLRTLTERVQTMKTFVDHYKRDQVLVNAQLPNPTNDSKIEKGPLIFNTYLHNTNRDYNVATGDFTAPVDGTYLISVKICITTNDDVTMNIMKNTDLLSRSVLSSRYDDRCLTIVEATELATEDTVWINISEPSYFARSGVGKSSFIVVLLK